MQTNQMLKRCRAPKYLLSFYLPYCGALHLMVYTGIRFYKYYGSLTLKNITGIRFYKYLWVSDPKKHSLFIGAEHRDICSYVNHQIIKGAEHRNINCHFSIILRVSDPINIAGIRFYKYYGSPTLRDVYRLPYYIYHIAVCYKYYGSLTLYHSSFITNY